MTRTVVVPAWWLMGVTFVLAALVVWCAWELL